MCFATIYVSHSQECLCGFDLPIAARVHQVVQEADMGASRIPVVFRTCPYRYIPDPGGSGVLRELMCLRLFESLCMPPLKPTTNEHSLFNLILQC